MFPLALTSTTDKSDCKVMFPAILAVPSMSKFPVADKLPLALILFEPVIFPPTYKSLARFEVPSISRLPVPNIFPLPLMSPLAVILP